MRNHKVAIQGAQSSFHDIAARKFYGAETDILSCRTFKEVCEKVISNEADYAVMAIENALTGSILSNYNLITSFGLKVIGEEFISVELHLMIHPQSLEENIHTVISHPIALAQSQDFLLSHPQWQPVEGGDTAGCAERVKNAGPSGLACIGNEESAERNGLKILHRNVEGEKINFTRFLILTRGSGHTANPDKASISFELLHKVGFLAEVLNIFKRANVNLTKIQSVPMIENCTAYTFHLDLSWNRYEDYYRAMKRIRKITRNLTILGEYKAATLPTRTFQKSETHLIEQV